MKQVTIKNQNNETVNFQIWEREELNKNERLELIHLGAYAIDWSDFREYGDYATEVEAIRAAGIADNTQCFVKFLISK